MTCPHCHGTGHPRFAQNDLCNTCKGAGEICRRCDDPADFRGQDLCPDCQLEEDERNEPAKEVEDE
jgi:DnaJ-class molecular chaperone